jgi:hypothetical protein
MKKRVLFQSTNCFLLDVLFHLHAFTVSLYELIMPRYLDFVHSLHTGKGKYLACGFVLFS